MLVLKPFVVPAPKDAALPACLPLEVARALRLLAVFTVPGHGCSSLGKCSAAKSHAEPPLLPGKWPCKRRQPP